LAAIILISTFSLAKASLKSTFVTEDHSAKADLNFSFAHALTLLSKEILAIFSMLWVLNRKPASLNL